MGLLVALFMVLLAAAPARAHLLGNSSVTHFSVLCPRPDRLDLDLLLDIAENPSVALLQKEIDTNGDGEDTLEEQRAWMDRKAVELIPQLHLKLDGRKLTLQVADAVVHPLRDEVVGQNKVLAKLPGVGGLPTYRLGIRYIADYPEPLAPGPHTLIYEDTSFPEHQGLMRILLEQSTFSTEFSGDTSTIEQELTAGRVPEAIRDRFKMKLIPLSDDAVVEACLSGLCWTIRDAGCQYTVRRQDKVLAVFGLPRVVVSDPRPSYWDEGDYDPMIYEQYDPANLPMERRATLNFHVETDDALPASAPAAVAETGPPATQTTAEPVNVASAEGTSRTGLDAYMAALADPRNDPAKQGPYQRDADRLIALLAQPWGWTVLLTITMLCFGWGAAHALMPGHAKTLVAAYLISQRGTWWHAVLLAIVVTVTHTALVVILGVVIWAYQKTNPTLGARLQLWLGTLAGLMVAGMGMTLIWRALTGRMLHHHHDHDEHHHHDHHHDHHEHEQARSWWHRLFTHSHPHASGHEHTHEHTHEHSHNHTGKTSKQVASAPMSVRLILVLGITGGIVPCPTATIIMFLGIGANLVAGALYAVGVFSLGLALTLMVVGFLALSSRRFASKIMTGSGEEQELSPTAQWVLLRAVPTVSGLVVLALGSAITAHYLYYARTGGTLFTWIQ